MRFTRFEFFRLLRPSNVTCSFVRLRHTTFPVTSNPTVFKRGIYALASRNDLAEPSVLSSAFGLRFPRWTASASPGRRRIAVAGRPTSATSFRQPSKLIRSNPLSRLPPRRSRYGLGRQEPQRKTLRHIAQCETFENRKIKRCGNSLGTTNTGWILTPRNTIVGQCFR